jgi:hypothetical protein
MYNKKIMYVGIREGLPNKLAIAVEVMPDNDLKVAVAVCNPKDVFKKSMGREIAIARLNKEGKYFVTKFTGHSEVDVARLFEDELDRTVRDAYLSTKWHNRYLTVVNNKLTAKVPSKNNYKCNGNHEHCK